MTKLEHLLGRMDGVIDSGKTIPHLSLFRELVRRCVELEERIKILEEKTAK